MLQNFLWESYEKLTILCFDVKNKLLMVGQGIYLHFILCGQYFANFCKLSSGWVCWWRIQKRKMYELEFVVNIAKTSLPDMPGELINSWMHTRRDSMGRKLHGLRRSTAVIMSFQKHWWLILRRPIFDTFDAWQMMEIWNLSSYNSWIYCRILYTT